MSPDGYRLVLVYEADLDDALRARCGELLYAVFGDPRVLGRGWHHTEPLYRVLALKGSELVGQRMTCQLANGQGLDLLGFGDAAVQAPHRRRGLAAAMTELAVAEALERRPDALLTMTTRMAPIYRALGFRRAETGMFLLCEPEMLPREEDPWVRWMRPEREQPVRYPQKF